MFLFSLFVLLCVIFFVALIRRKLVRFSDAFCGQMDDMLSENMQPKQTACEESLFYKINYRLGRLYEVMQENKNSIVKERTDLQELISDISHQVKTPIANLKMINNTLLENEVPPQKQKEFLTAQASQLDKLDFLMQAMIKTSRLETGVYSRWSKNSSLFMRPLPLPWRDFAQCRKEKDRCAGGMPRAFGCTPMIENGQAKPC